ncbi:MAG: Rrf2 family transcriptional regulator [Fibrobacterales bacterium]
MKLSTKTRYGTRAIIEIAKNFNVKPTKRKDIVATQGIPDSYLENILISLKNSGIINTIRGAKGGFIMRREPEDVTLLDIFNALEGSQAPVPCIINDDCAQTNECITRPIWIELHQAQQAVLSKHTIQSLVDKEQTVQHNDYSI